MQNGLSCVDGCQRDSHHRQGGHTDAVFLTKGVSPTGEIPEAAVSPGWRITVQQCPLGGRRRAIADSDHNMLAGSDLFAARYTVGFLGSSLECGPFVPRGSCPLDRPSTVAGTGVRAPRRQAPTARPGSVCPKSSSRTWLVGLGGRWTPTLTRSGCGNPAAFTSMTDRRSRCPIRRRTSALIRNPTRRNPAWAFLSHESRPSSRSPVGRFLISGICRYAGKGQSELGMLRTLWNLFRPGDVMLADRLMCTWTEMVMLKQRGVDCVCRLTSHRTADFRRGKRLGKDDHIVKWLKPTKAPFDRPKTYNSAPRVPDDPRMPSPDRAAWLSRQNHHRRHDVAGCR